MGVQGFQKWCAAKFPEAYVALYDRDRTNVDHVYIDLNAYIHNACRRCWNETNAIQQLFKMLRTILRQVQPRFSFHLMVDGPAPVAKLYEQRQRRANAKQSSSAKSAVPGYHITPGTAFMRTLTQALHYFCCQYLSGTQAPAGLQAFVSPSGSAGEGEVKITNAVIAKCRQHPDHTHVFVGGDSDGILLGMASLVPNVYVYCKGDANKTACLSHLKLLEVTWIIACL